MRASALRTGWLPVAVLATGLMLEGCAGDGSTPSDVSSQFDVIQQQIFNVSCLSAGCHNSVARAGDLVLEAGVSYDNLVDVLPFNPSARDDGLLRVEPFDAVNSFLLIKLIGPPPEQGIRMPQGKPPLPQSQINMIQQWILDGAPPPSGPTVTPTDSPTLTPVPSETPTATATLTPTDTLTPTLSPTPTISPTGTVLPSATATNTPLPSATPTPTETAPPTATASATAIVSFEEIQRTIFDVHCLTIGCHASDFQAGNLNLDPGMSFGDLVNVIPDNPAARNAGLLRVTPFEPAESFLIRKLENPTLPEGGRMPLGQPPLPAAQIEQIRAWILRGAPDD